MGRGHGVCIWQVQPSGQHTALLPQPLPNTVQPAREHSQDRRLPTSGAVSRPICSLSSLSLFSPNSPENTSVHRSSGRSSARTEPQGGQKLQQPLLDPPCPSLLAHSPGPGAVPAPGELLQLRRAAPALPARRPARNNCKPTVFPLVSNFGTGNMKGLITGDRGLYFYFIN